VTRWSSIVAEALFTGADLLFGHRDARPAGPMAQAGQLR
jgi:hypothetical protein